jgi:hypothetical protein
MVFLQERKEVMRALIVAIILAASSLAQANPQASSPLNTLGTCVKEVTGGAAAQTIAALCGITDQNVGASGFSIHVHSTTLTACLGGSDVTTTSTAPAGKCWAVCDTTVGTQCVGVTQPVRGNIHKTYVRAATTVTVSVIFGTGYP